MERRPGKWQHFVYCFLKASKLLWAVRLPWDGYNDGMKCSSGASGDWIVCQHGHLSLAVHVKTPHSILHAANYETFSFDFS